MGESVEGGEDRAGGESGDDEIAFEKVESVEIVRVARREMVMRVNGKRLPRSRGGEERWGSHSSALSKKSAVAPSRLVMMSSLTTC